ncbi:uncharacterized protein PHACADRAFT_263276 [Phanerochaete carnosa HHB-10118-sp]|uniref:Phytanoyl-CoA dioxygenase n=1 Tax=Phanerochaete carnosa (strain HHB-10118-sp) TaxID=650164 RepID=K5VWQ9_PHACS|nr:uncharacterized protein PHACADRAFT_263276 [Phanerochaete carnosa HHB-10118-sp]EKM51240.1 hypothetical protein PHACADRAFT_263276 [Phanerochaete carnosa HHB-10118-sp]
MLLAAHRATARTRTGNWPHRRTVGCQFPPFDEDGSPDVWGVQHMMHPALGESVFAEWYTSEALLQTVCELMGCGKDELQMELFNMLINPERADFALRWHRDDIHESATADEEREALAKWQYGVQWNAALLGDTCLFVVPDSHTMPRTPEQRTHSSTLDPPKDPMDMPGAIRVTLKPGETVFYNSNILHCATYTHTTPRLTLHACIGCTRGGSTRARNILQHGLAWMEDEKFRDTLNDTGKEMLERLVKMKNDTGDVGYSLQN